MSADIIIFAGLTIIAILFVVVPLLIGSNEKAAANDIAIQSQLNEALFADNLLQLQQQKNNGEISDKAFDKLKQELEKQLEQDQQFKHASNTQLSPIAVRWVYALAVVIIPALALFFYHQWGAKPDWEIYQTNLSKVRQQERGADEAELRLLNKQLESLLEQRLEQREDNLHNWFLLARTYAELGNYQSAKEAYQAILDVQPNSPDVLNEMAQVEYLANGNRFTPEVKDLFDRAIALAPRNVRILSFAALTASNSGAFRQALVYWQSAVNMSEPNTQQYQYMMQGLQYTQNQLAAAGVDVEEGEIADVDGPSMKVNVALGEGLELNPNYRVFVYARAWEGPKMPLAIEQDLHVSDLPITIILDESMVMQPGMPTLSQFPTWQLVARVSQTGVANAQSGDWEAVSGPITKESSEQPVQLVITSQIP